MSVEKSVVRIGVAREIGSALDDSLEGAVAESNQYTGAKAALDQTAKMVQMLAKLVDESLDGAGPEAGQIPDLDTAKLVKKFITRAVAVVESAAMSAEQKRLMADGKVQAYTAAVKSVKKRVDAEEAAVKAVASEAARVVDEVGAADEVDLRAPGTRPAYTVKTRRLAEEAAGKAPSSPEKAPTKRSRTKSKAKPRKAGAPKRRGRKPKDGADTG